MRSRKISLSTYLSFSASSFGYRLTSQEKEHVRLLLFRGASNHLRASTRKKITSRRRNGRKMSTKINGFMTLRSEPDAPARSVTVMMSLRGRKSKAVVKACAIFAGDSSVNGRMQAAGQLGPHDARCGERNERRGSVHDRVRREFGRLQHDFGRALSIVRCVVSFDFHFYS